MSRLAAYGLVATSVAATAVIVLAEASLGPYAILAVLMIAFGALAVVLGLGSLRRWLGVGAVLAVSGGLLLGSALAPAHSSDDLYAYAMYGRTIVVHHENPYVHPPSDYRDDPLFKHVSTYWESTTRGTVPSSSASPRPLPWSGATTRSPPASRTR